MSRTLQILYQAQISALIQQRENLIIDLESINNQIAQIRREVRQDGITLDV